MNPYVIKVAMQCPYSYDQVEQTALLGEQVGLGPNNVAQLISDHGPTSSYQIIRGLAQAGAFTGTGAQFPPVGPIEVNRWRRGWLIIELELRRYWGKCLAWLLKKIHRLRDILSGG